MYLKTREELRKESKLELYNTMNSKWLKNPQMTSHDLLTLMFHEVKDFDPYKSLDEAEREIDFKKRVLKTA